MKWKKEKIENISNNLDSKRIPLNEIERKKKEYNGTYPYVGANNILGYINEYIFDEKILCIAEDGGSWGKNQKCSFIINEKCWVNNHAHVLTAKKNLSLEFLMYYLNFADLNKYVTGSTRGKLTKSALNSIEIPLPDLPIQNRIVAILNEADALQKHDVKLLAKYDELLNATFSYFFGNVVSNENNWETKKIADCISFLTSGSRGWARYYSASGDVFLRINNVGSNNLKLDNLIYVNAPDTAEAKRTRVEEGDILFSITADLGRTAVIPKGFPVAYINQHLALIRLKHGYNPYFVSQFLSSSGGLSQLKKLTKGGVKAGLNFEDIRSIKLLIPPIDLQNQFSKIAADIEEQKILVTHQRQQSKALFQRLLQQAFKGEL